MEEPASFAPPDRPPNFLSHDEIHTLCKQGYLTVKLSTALQESLLAFTSAADDFFHLPLLKKSELYPPAKGPLEHGYYNIATEKQFITFRHSSAHSDPPRLETLLHHVWHDLAHLLYRILVDVGNFLYISPYAWQSLVAPSLTLPYKGDATPSLLRTFRYEPHSGFADPHNDLGLLTLCICRGAGLQVWERAQETVTHDLSATGDLQGNIQQEKVEARWSDAGEVTLLVGDTLRVLSGNRIRSGRHRVVSDPLGRDSTVFALRPSTDTTLDLRLFGGEGEVETKALWAAIKGNRVNVNAQKDIRERQRQKRT